MYVRIYMRIATRYTLFYYSTILCNITTLLKSAFMPFLPFVDIPCGNFKFQVFYVISVFIQGAYMFQYLHVALIMYIRWTETIRSSNLIVFKKVLNVYAESNSHFCYYHLRIIIYIKVTVAVHYLYSHINKRRRCLRFSMQE